MPNVQDEQDNPPAIALMAELGGLYILPGNQNIHIEMSEAAFVHVQPRIVPGNH